MTKAVIICLQYAFLFPVSFYFKYIDRKQVLYDNTFVQNTGPKNMVAELYLEYQNIQAKGR